MRSKRYRIKSKFRFTTSITILLIGLVFTINTFTGFSDASSLTKYDPIEIEIQEGDCLWNIAHEYGPKGMDKRKIVYDICRLNDITAGSIYSGQMILFPDYNK